MPHGRDREQGVGKRTKHKGGKKQFKRKRKKNVKKNIESCNTKTKAVASIIASNYLDKTNNT
jgi:hypothetical protein